MFNPVAIITIKDLGEMRFELYRDIFDSTGNFIELANQKYYDNTKLFNLQQELFIQGGLGSQHELNYTIRGEFARNGFINIHKHRFGSLAYVRSLNLDSAQSKFYISLAENPAYDDNFAVFGDIIYGQELLTQINEQAEKKWIIEAIRINDRGEEVPKCQKIYLTKK